MQQETIETIQRVIKKIAPKYTFGYYDVEDIEQECFIMALKGLDKYDPKLSALETFLHTYLNSQMKNFIRDNYLRRDVNCHICQGEDVNCPHCLPRRWKFAKKKHLMEPIDITTVDNEACINDDVHEDLVNKEIFSIINQCLEIHLRTDYLKMLEGSYVPKQRRIIIKERIREIIEEHGYGE